MQKMKLTPFEKSYWCNEGAYTKEIEKLFEDLVPAVGSAKTLHGELLRGASKLYYEFFNNGNGNAFDTSEMDEVFDEEDYSENLEDVEVKEFYKKFLKLIDSTIKNTTPEITDIIESVTRIIKECAFDMTGSCNKSNEEIYNRMIDYVVYYILNTNDVNELPNWYKVD